ncbi:hypothetical protein H1R20_g10021, partial [Candolleomyces eurysporus]
MVLAEAVLVLRVYALGGRGRRLKAYLIIHFVLIDLGATALGITFTGKFQAHVASFDVAPFPTCWAHEMFRPNLLSAAYGMTLFNELGKLTFFLIMSDMDS